MEKEKQSGGEKFIPDLAELLAAQKRVNVDRNWLQLRGRIRREERLSLFYRFVRGAAAILLLPLLLLSGFLYYQLREWQTMQAELVELTTAYGVISEVTLSDGSEVWLNSGSKLVYPKRFNSKHREVYLSGEAYFKVESDPSRRFDVKTSGGLTVSAYGTEFNVQAYNEEPEIKATLAKGRISVRQSDSGIAQDLNAGEQILFSKTQKRMNRQSVSLLAETAWREGKLVFRRTPMEEVAKRLSRHFNVDILLQGKEIHEYSYSATFTTETLAEILSLLEKTAPIRCETIEPEQQDDYAFSRKRVLIRPL